MEIKGKNYKLKYTNKSLFEIEKQTGIPIFKLVTDEEKMQSIEMIVRFIAAGIDELSFDDVMDGIELGRLEENQTEIIEAFQEAFATGSKKK